MVLARRRPAGGRDRGGRDGLDLDFRLGDIERVAHGDEVARALARHDAGDACACEDVALFGAVLEHHGLGFRVHEDGALGDRDAFGDLFVSHVDHAHVAVLVDMCEIVAVGVALAGGGGGVRRVLRLGGAWRASALAPLDKGEFGSLAHNGSGVLLVHGATEGARAFGFIGGVSGHGDHPPICDMNRWVPSMSSCWRGLRAMALR